MAESTHPGDPFAADGAWYRGNLHTHSTNSDGDKSVEDAVGWYREHGYDFMALTDHRVLSETRDLTTPDFVTIPGMEMHGPDPFMGVRYHIVGLGIHSFTEWPEDYGPQETIDRVNADGGVAILAHPYWLGQTATDMCELTGFIGMEVFNSVCDRSRAKGFSSVQWDDYLQTYGLTWALATDDTHWRHDEQGRGWVMVRTADFSIEGLLGALRRGHFYSSMGPRIQHVELQDGAIRIACSPARRVSVLASRAHGHSYHAAGGTPLTEVRHELRGEEGYVRIEVEDDEGLVAWTNPWRV